MVDRRETGFDRLVGRNEELGVLDRALDEVEAGGSAAVAVVGEAGIGKTRLLSELTERGTGRGFGVFAGRGSELAPEVPFGLVVEALDDVVTHLDPEVGRRVGRARLAELAGVLPSLPRPDRRSSSPLGVERFRCYEAVRAVVEELSLQRPSLLVFDDVHWADPASLELVAYLLRRGLGQTLLALAYRQAAPSLLSGATARAVRESRLEILDLGPLAAEQVADLLGEAFTPSTRASLYTESGGNPFYLEQLVRVAQVGAGTAGQPTPRILEGDLGASVPGGVRAAIAQELAHLMPEARLLAQAAAVAGDPFELDLAVEVAGVEPASAYAALDELVGAGAVRPTEVPARFRFRHPIVRRAVYGEATHGWRLQAHRRAAEAVARRGGPLGVRAQHLLLSGAAVGDEAAIAVLVEAGLDAAARTPAAAAAWLDGAARLLPVDAPVERHLAVLTSLADALATAGRLSDSRAALRRAFELVPPGDGATRRLISVMMARLGRLMGSTEDAHTVIASALDEVEPGTAEAATLTLYLAHDLSMVGRWKDAATVADQARAQAAELGDPELLAVCTASTASYRSWGVVDPLDEARALADGVAARLDALGDHQLSHAYLDAYSLLTLAELNLERWPLLEAHAERAIRRCRAIGEGFFYLVLVQALALGRMLQGRLSDAREASDTIFGVAQLVNNDYALVFIAASRCWLLTLQGQLTAALAVGREAVDVAGRGPGAQYIWMAHVCCGMALVEAGEHEAGRRQMLSAGGVALEDAPPAARPHFLRSLAEADVALDRLDEAELVGEQAEGIARRLGLPMRTGDARYIRAMVLLARGEHAAAADVALAAAELHDQPGARIEAARARLLAADALVATGSTDAARQELGRAHATFRESGAVRLADRAAQRLRKLGVPRSRILRPSDRPDSGPGSLSDRERQVATLAAQGYTNRQIAEKLFLSPRTVETHMAHVFAKLGISTRVALIAALEP